MLCPLSVQADRTCSQCWQPLELFLISPVNQEKKSRKAEKGKRTVRLLICAGGTGGGVYPALAVLQTMQNKAEVLWVGGEGGMEARLVERAKVPFKTIPAAGVHGVGLKTLPGNVIRLVRGFFAARRILHEFKPDVLFFTGGYVAVPMALAGMRIPTVLYVPDIEPALALKTLARFADKIAVTAEESFRFFSHPERLVLTGYPTRTDLAKWTAFRCPPKPQLDRRDPGPAGLRRKQGRPLNQQRRDGKPICPAGTGADWFTSPANWIGRLSKPE